MDQMGVPLCGACAEHLADMSLTDGDSPWGDGEDLFGETCRCRACGSLVDVDLVFVQQVMVW